MFAPKGASDVWPSQVMFAPKGASDVAPKAQRCCFAAMFGRDAAKRGKGMRYRNVLFDLDGTLTDPAEGITNALMHAQRRLGMEVSPREALYVFIGPPLMESFMGEWGLSRAESEQAIVYYREYYGVRPAIWVEIP